MRRKITIILAGLLLLGISGCTLEDAILLKFMDEDGHYNYCPPVREDEVFPNDAFKSIRYSVQSGDGSDDMQKVCNREDCISKSNCCGLSGERAELFHLSFDYGICPRNMVCKAERDSSAYYCELPDVVCNVEQLDCGGYCINPKSDIDHCGGCFKACTTAQFAHSTQAYCKDSVCSPLECEKGYHLEIDHCAEDTLEACGTENCKKITGWGDGRCEEGKCIIDSCTSKYHRYDSGQEVICELNSPENCGSHSRECELPKGVRFVTCNENAECEATKCDKGYHWDRDGKECVEDSIEQCGWFNNNCNALSGWKEGAPGNKCIDGVDCYAGECDEGFHVFNNKEKYGINIPCEADSNKHCGNHETDCTAEGNKCSSGTCVANCDVGETQCSEDGCKKLLVDINHCGDCNHKCVVTDIPNATAVTCNNGSCEPTLCNDGWHLNGATCVEDTAEHCGQSAINCNGSIAHGTAFACKSGQCKVTACEGGYHLNGNSCVADSNQKCGGAEKDCTSAFANGSGVCQGGQCVLNACNRGYHIANGVCEIDTINNCGGIVCSVPTNMNVTCVGGTCTNNGCNAGYGNCDGNVDNGCEIKLADYAMASCSKCDSNYVDCSRSGSAMPLCLKLSGITEAYCWAYCTVTGKGGQNDSYNTKKCNPGQTCSLSGYNVSCK